MLALFWDDLFLEFEHMQGELNFSKIYFSQAKHVKHSCIHMTFCQEVKLGEHKL